MAMSDDDTPGGSPPNQGGASAPGDLPWRLGDNHSAQQWANKLSKRGWTDSQIDEAIAVGQQFAATNQIDPEHSATRYVHPKTGRSVVIDDVTREVIHVGGDGFLY